MKPRASGGGRKCQRVVVVAGRLHEQVTIPENGQSFALIYSIEDPLGNTEQAGVGLQVRLPRPHVPCHK